MKKLTAVFLIGIAVAWFIANKFITHEEQAFRRGRGEVSVAVETEALKHGDIHDAGIFTGSIEANSKFTVAPKISGRIKKLYLDIGDKITNGAIVAKLDDEELILGVRQAESALEIANANFNESQELLEISKRELDRVKTMHKQKVASEVEVENTQAAHKSRHAKHLVNQALLSQAESTLETAKLKLAYANIDASWSGGSKDRFIAERFLNEGAMVTANTPLVSVIDIDTLTVVINVIENDYFKIKKGMQAKISPSALPNESFMATVERIAPQMDEASRQARIELRLENKSHRLKPGMFVQAEIIYDQRKDTIVAPITAVVRRNDTEGVFIANLEEKKAVFTPTKLGFVLGSKIEILEPKSLTGQVITLGQHLLEDGMKIIVAGQEENNSEQQKNKGKKKDQ